MYLTEYCNKFPPKMPFVDVEKSFHLVLANMMKIVFIFSLDDLEMVTVFIKLSIDVQK